MVYEKSDILVILDIDETLVYSTKTKLDIDHDFKLGDYFVYKRPYLDDFIDFVFHNFSLAIWSSATDDYVREITEKLGLEDKAVFCWARSKATFKSQFLGDLIDEEIIESDDHQYYIKRLKKVKKLGFHLNKILIIDDTPTKSQTNFGNAIYVSEFKGNPRDTELLDLSNYLTTYKVVENVRVIEKRDWRKISSKS